MAKKKKESNEVTSVKSYSLEGDQFSNKQEFYDINELIYMLFERKEHIYIHYTLNERPG